MHDSIPYTDAQRINEIIAALKDLSYPSHSAEKSSFTHNSDTDCYELDIHNTRIEDTTFKIADILRVFGSIETIEYPTLHVDEITDDTPIREKTSNIKFKAELPKGTEFVVKYHPLLGPLVLAIAYREESDYNLLYEELYQGNDLPEGY